LIAIEAEKQGLKIPALRAIQTTSEPMPPAMRQRIERVFQCEVFDKYGSRETNIVSHESPTHDGMLIQSENVITEFLNNEGNACQPDETGKVVLTTLNNLSMPLIRYETSDLAAPLSGHSQNGYGFPRMTAVSGRHQDLIYTPHGDYIDSYFFSYLFMQFQAIHWFQVIQYHMDALTIQIMAPEGLSSGEIESILERIRHHTGYPFKIDLNFITAMPESPTGKFRLCISHIKEAQRVAEAISMGVIK
jgi:phenylacetate-CoA ligase